MCAHDAVDGIQAYSRSFTDALGRKERLKDMRLYRIGNTGTVVDDLDENEIELSGSSNNQLALASHGIDGIVNEVGPDLIQFAPACEDPGKVGIELALHFHAVLQPEFQHRQRTFDAAVNDRFPAPEPGPCRCIL